MSYVTLRANKVTKSALQAHWTQTWLSDISVMLGDDVLSVTLRFQMQASWGGERHLGSNESIRICGDINRVQVTPGERVLQYVYSGIPRRINDTHAVLWTKKALDAIKSEATERTNQDCKWITQDRRKPCLRFRQWLTALPRVFFCWYQGWRQEHSLTSGLWKKDTFFLMHRWREVALYFSPKKRKRKRERERCSASLEDLQSSIV